MGEKGEGSGGGEGGGNWECGTPLSTPPNYIRFINHLYRNNEKM